MRKVIPLVVAGLAFLITPSYFLYDRLFNYHFGAVELTDAVEGKWFAKLSPDTGHARVITFTIEQARAPQHSQRDDTGWIRSASACGNRTLIKSADACISVTRMAVDIVTRDGDRSSGELEVHGNYFEQGSLTFELDGYSIGATVSRTGEITGVVMRDGTATLERVSRQIR